jgi:short-subunit dehydrogenase
MSDAIIVALITGGMTLIGTVFANYSMRKKDGIQQARREQKLDDRLDRLEAKVEEHNNYGKKFGEASQTLTAIQKDIEWLKRK